MTNQLRVWKVLLVLLISMTGGAVVLMALGNNAPSAGAFCLYSYYQLAPTDNAIASRVVPLSNRWKRIELFYSETRVGNIDWLASANGLKNPADLNCHFVVCNGYGGHDGEIQATEKWQRQLSAKPARNWHSEHETIRICIVADGRDVLPTDSQIKRVESLVESLSRRFNIPGQCVNYPGDVQANN